MNLSLNSRKLNMPKVKTVTHVDDLLYLFKYVIADSIFHFYVSKTYFYSSNVETSAKGMNHLYSEVKNNRNDPVNQQTLAAIKFVTKFFAEFAKTG